MYTVTVLLNVLRLLSVLLSDLAVVLFNCIDVDVYTYYCIIGQIK